MLYVCHTTPTQKLFCLHVFRQASPPHRVVVDRLTSRLLIAISSIWSIPRVLVNIHVLKKRCSRCKVHYCNKATTDAFCSRKPGTSCLSITPFRVSVTDPVLCIEIPHDDCRFTGCYSKESLIFFIHIIHKCLIVTRRNGAYISNRQLGILTDLNFEV